MTKKSLVWLPAGVHVLRPWLLSRDVRAFLGGGRFHQENQKGEYQGNYRENQERVEIGQSRGLLFAKILQRLQSHPVRGGQISSLLQEAFCLGVRL